MDPPSSVAKLALSLLIWGSLLSANCQRQEDESPTTLPPTSLLLDPSMAQVPLIETVGSGALLTCVVRGIGMAKDNSTAPSTNKDGKDDMLASNGLSLIWRSQRGTVLTAGDNRVTSDKRVKVIHDKGGDVYVLSISNLTLSDSGVYVCEVNTQPPTRTFHKLAVVEEENTTPYTIAPLGDSEDENKSAGNVFQTERPVPAHDFTECCKAKGVSKRCQGFCDVGKILSGDTGISEADSDTCEDELPDIVQCMADGRNHVPCCVQAGVPDICQDVCRGEYTKRSSSDLRTHLSCSASTPAALTCIAEGMSLLPPRPQELTVTKVTDQGFTLEWSSPESTPETRFPPIDTFTVIVREVGEMLHNSLERTKTTEGNGLDETDNIAWKVIVPADTRKKRVRGLKSFTVYNATVMASNENGNSLPSYNVVVLTRTPDQEDWSKTEKSQGELDELATKLPDTKDCCKQQNVTHQRCIDVFCDPHSIKSASVPDLMICAPWSARMLGCVLDHEDHSDCCAEEGVPMDTCGDICRGTVDQLDYRHFKCVEHLPKISNCAMWSYEVLPSRPRNFRFSNIGTNIGLLHWDPPATLASTVTSYIVNLKLMTPPTDDGDNKSDDKDRKRDSKMLMLMQRSMTETVWRTDRTDFVLEDLKPDSSYEVYVESENQFGVGEFSNRIVFRTAKRSMNDEDDDDNNSDKSHQTQKCCQSAGVKDQCLPLCSFNQTLSSARRLSSQCSSHLGQVTKCLALGRNHLPCCQRRGVDARCQPLCQGIQVDPKSSIFTTCLPYVGNILMCLEEGLTALPPPVKNFRAVAFNSTAVHFAWDGAKNDDKEDNKVDKYEVYYKMVKNASSDGDDFVGNKIKNSTTTRTAVTGLQPGTRYQFFAVSHNKLGSSMPSSIVVMRMPKKGSEVTKLTKTSSTPSPPHRIAVLSKGTDFVELHWTSPAISLPDQQIKYTIYVNKTRSGDSDESSGADNSTYRVYKGITSNHFLVSKLTPNTLYTVHLSSVVASPDGKSESESRASETVLQWTDPVVPAYAEAPTIMPASGEVVSGGQFSVLCIAMGSPVPAVTLYISGHPVRTETTRHMVTTIQNATKFMEDIACHADNGHGTPNLARRRIRILTPPKVWDFAQQFVRVEEGEHFSTSCIASGTPEPTVTLTKDGSQVITVEKVKDSSSFVKVKSDGVEKIFTYEFSLPSASLKDGGFYSCAANNSVGTAAKGFRVLVVPKPDTQGAMSMRRCCLNLNVSSSCLDLCSTELHDLDVDYFAFRPDCFGELDKLMWCGADGSDHRHCCSRAGVPSTCLDWCRGSTGVRDSRFCALTHLRTIGQCFKAGNGVIPGPPGNVRVSAEASDAAKAEWDAPEKNPNAVKLYRIIVREEGKSEAHKVDTTQTFLIIRNLEPSKSYELYLKSGNENGTSLLTGPFKFNTAEGSYFVEKENVISPVPSAIGISVAVFLILLAAVALGFYLHRRKQGSQFKARTFENPKDIDETQIHSEPEITMSTISSNQK